MAGKNLPVQFHQSGPALGRYHIEHTIARVEGNSKDFQDLSPRIFIGEDHPEVGTDQEESVVKIVEDNVQSFACGDSSFYIPERRYISRLVFHDGFEISAV
jgi:hypothetical protein